MSPDEAKRSVPVASPAKPTSERKEPILSRPEGRKSADMKDELQKETVDIAVAAFEKNIVEEHIKKEFDKKHMVLLGHCIVGRNVGEIVSKTQERTRWKCCYIDNVLGGGDLCNSCYCKSQV